jgi:hypothetical protein
VGILFLQKYFDNGFVFVIRVEANMNCWQCGFNIQPQIIYIEKHNPMMKWA